MNKYQHKLRMLIATGSAVGFLGGWALLAHSGKPVAAGTVDTPTINMESSSIAPASLPPLDFRALENSGSSSTVQTFAPAPSFQTFSRPRLRTGGS
jgi:hypothetical protein